MKKFTKLALAASVALSANAMAMQAMDDSALSSTTGQDGINIGIGISKVTIEKLFIHDNDGLKGGYTDVSTGTAVAKDAGAGAIVIQGRTKDTLVTNTLGDDIDLSEIGVYVGANYSDNGAYLLASKNLADLQIDTDAGNGNAFINIAAQVSGLEIHVGEIGVTASNDVPGTTATSIRHGGKLEGANKNYNAILSGLSIKTGQLSANVQLGSAPQGAMIKLDSVIQGGLTIENLGILDNSTKDHVYQTVATPAVPEVRDPDTDELITAAVPAGTANVATKEAGEIFIKSIKITDAESKNLTVNAAVKVFNNAYLGDGTDVKKQANVTIVSTSGAHDMYIEDIRLGSRAAGNSIGDVEIQGMQTYYSPSVGVYNPGSIITISGR